MTDIELIKNAQRKTKLALQACEKITDDPTVISSLEMAMEILDIIEQEIITGVPYEQRRF